MPKNVMKLLKPSRNVGRNPFDLSHRHLMTANFGELLPISCIETIPGDYFTMRVSDLLRALPMVTSPFMRVKQHIDVWFTPYDYLWHNFEAFMTMKDDMVSSAMKGFDYCPHTTKNKLAQIVGNDYSGSATDVVGRSYITGAKKLLDFLGYGAHETKTGDSDTSKRVNLWRLAQYNKLWYDEYRQKYYDDGKRMLSSNANAAQLFNFDYKSCDSEANALVDVAQLQPMAQMRYRLWKKDIFTGALPATQFGSVSAVSVGDLSGLAATFSGTPVTPTFTGNSTTLTGETGVPLNANGNPWTPVIESDYGKWEFEDVPQGYFTGDRINTDVETEIKRGVDYNWSDNGDGTRDIHDGALATLGGGSAYHNHQILEINASHVHKQHGSFTPSGTISTITPQGTVTLSGSSTGAGFDILALRKAEALQIWRENALRAGNRISDNMRAHYGDDAEYDDHRSTLLGSIDAPLNIGDIDAHAQTGDGGNQQLGDVAGKGLSSVNEKVFKFKAKKFGCIMVMFSLIPEAEYESSGIDIMNSLLEREDYFQSEFQNTGLQALNINFIKYTPNPTYTGETYGFAPAYIGYKQKLDKCYAGYWSDEPFSPWASPKTDIEDWYNSMSGNIVIPLATLYINPILFDRNFGVSVTGEPDAEATSEQVLCDFYFDVTAIRGMSVVGLPQNL